MIILVVRTDKPEAEIGVYDGRQKLAYQTWQAHRELAETIHSTILDVLQTADVRLHELQGIVAFKGPGSFTGLRIGLTVCNALAYGLSIPIVTMMGDDWLPTGLDRLLHADNEVIAMPEYGAAPHITAPKH